MFERILLAVDGSKHSTRAAQAASALAAKFGSELHVLTVARPVKASPELEHFLKSEKLIGDSHYVLDPMADGILDDAKEIAEEAGVKSVKTVAREGKTARTIVDYAKGRKMDLIVLGTRGRGEVASVLLGSVSHKVSLLAPCKVMLV